jgi:hypothetical protein
MFIKPLLPPAYLLFSIFLMIALLLGSLTPFFIVIIFIVLIDRMFIGVEEQNMEYIYLRLG